MIDGDGVAEWLPGAMKALGVEAASATPLVGIQPWSPRPRSYLISTPDGCRLKVRLARREALAARAAWLGQQLGDPRFPAPLARVGRVTAEPWIDGVPLSSLPLRHAYLDDAADLLARVHRFAGVGPEHLPRVRSVLPVVRRAERHLVELAAAGQITSRDAATFGDLVRRDLPAATGWGLTHGDFCAENLVRRPDGELVCVDNELIGRGFIEYDLGRCWYRWPMPGAAYERFEATYRSKLGAGRPPSGERRAWRVAAALKGLHLRHRRRAPAEAARDALRLVLES
jgi:aminoglycoside phosphotransferase (APT) family kinase protein